MKKISALLIIALLFTMCPSVFAAAASPEYVTDKVSAVVRGDAGASYAGQSATFVLLKGAAKPSDISSPDDILGIGQTKLDEAGRYEFEVGLDGIDFDGLASDGHVFVRVGSDDISDTVIEAQADRSKWFFTEMKLVSNADGRQAELSIRAPENFTDDNVFWAVAQYDADDMLISVNTPGVTVQNGGAEYTVSAVPSVDAKYCKVFAWYNQTIPLTRSFTAQKTPKNILVIGNSFSVDSTRYVHALAENLGVELNVYHYQHSGGSVSSLYEKRNGTTADSEWYFSLNYNENSVSTIADGRNPTLDTFLDQNEMDAVVIQNYWAQSDAIAQYEQPEGYQPESGKKNYYPSPNYEIMAKYIKEKQPNAQIFINSIWSNEQGYWMSNHVNQNYAANGFENESAYMYDLFEKYNGQSAIDVGSSVVSGSKIGIKGEPVTQLPVGYAVQYAKNYKNEDGERIFDTVKNSQDFYGWEAGSINEAPVYEGKIRLYRDGYHLSQTGRYLAACVWVEVLTGMDVRRATFKPSKSDDQFVTQALDASGNTVEGRAYYYYPDMDNDIAETVRSIAHEAVKKFTSQGTRGLNDPSLKF